MTIRFACTSCGQKLSVPDDKAGVAARCPKCRKSLVVPASPPPAAPALTPVVAPASTPASTPVAGPVVAPAPRPTPQRPLPPPASPVASIPRITPPAVSPPAVTPPAVMPPAAAPKPQARETWVHEPPRDDEQTPPELAWMYEQQESSRPAARTVASPASPLHPGLVVAQGLLLVVMLAVGFGLGRVSQRGGSLAPETLAARPATLTGKVEYGTSGGTLFPDEGAVVLVFPTSQRPTSDDRLAYEGLRPTDPPLDASHESLEKLRLMGGGMARVDSAGQYRIALPKSGSYYVLVLSHHGARRANVAPNKSDLAQIGRFVNMANELLGDRRYRWTTEEIDGSKQLAASLPH